MFKALSVYVTFTFLMLFYFAEIYPVIWVELASLEIALIGTLTLLNVSLQLLSTTVNVIFLKRASEFHQ